MDTPGVRSTPAAMPAFNAPQRAGDRKDPDAVKQDRKRTDPGLRSDGNPPKRSIDTSSNNRNQDQQTRAPSAKPPASDTASPQTSTIYGTNAASPPDPDDSHDSLQQREQRVEDYAGRVKSQLANIESGSEAERNVKFLNARPFTQPAGYFSGGLLAAGYDPNQEIKPTFSSYVGKGHPEKQTGSEERGYRAWQIAAGALAHDRPEQGGVLNFQSMKLAPADETKVNNLESLGAKLQSHWKQDVAGPMQDPSGPLAARAGKADAYSVGATLQSLQADKAAFGRLSPAGQQAINRTLGNDGQVIIPNVYGYPMAGHAFVPYKPYDGNYVNRPNEGLMVDLDQGAVAEIRGDKDFASWAKRNRDDVVQSFNARDRQGGLDAHWPKAGEVLDHLIAGGNTTYRGYKNLFSDQNIPVRELFNYTRSRGGDYQLKYGNLKNAAEGGAGIASKYQALNAKNSAWEDQTEVFGPDQQNWKSAKGIWGKTFGYLPVVGNLGNIVFGAHDSVNGMTAMDRAGGTAAAAISSLQLMYEMAPAAAGLGAGKSSPALSSAAGHDPVWKYNPETSEFRFTPPQRVNGKIGYPMSPINAPKIGGDNRPGLPRAGGVAPPQESDSGSVSSHVSAGRVSPSSGESTPAASPKGARHGTSTSDEPGSDTESAGASDPLIAPKSRKPFIRPKSRRPAAPLASGESLPSSDEVAKNGSSGPSGAASRRSSAQRSISGAQNVNPLSTEEEAGFTKYFPAGLSEAESYLKQRALGMNRSPAFLSSDQYRAPQSWANMPQKELNRFADRYLSVWEPEPRKADFNSGEEFNTAHQEYADKMEKYRENGNFNIQKYWDDLVSVQNNKFRTFVDNQTKRLAIATKVYDDFMSNPTRYRVKPDDPYTIRKQLTGAHDGKRDAMYLQREALNFGKNRFYELDSKEISELRSSFLSLFGRDNSKIETAFLNRKSELEDELYQYGNSGAPRDVAETKKKALQDRFNGDIETAIKNMDLMYKRIALYGTIGTLSISAISAILWKTVDEIRKG